MRKSFVILWIALSFISTSIFTLHGDDRSDVEDTFGLSDDEYKTSKTTAKHHQKVSPIENLEPHLSAECEPLTSVAGCVNVLSGSFFQVDKDIASHAIEPLHLTRIYDSGNESESILGYGFASQFPLWATLPKKGSRYQHALISEREGFLIPYRGFSQSDHHKVCQIDPRLLEKGYTNMSKSAVSGHANFVNWKAAHIKTKEFPHGRWIVQLGDGTKRYYDKYVELSNAVKRKVGLPSTRAYLLTEEVKPNGNRLLYTYKTIHDKPRLVQVKTFNRMESATLDELNFHYSPKGVTVTNGCGESVQYIHQNEQCLYSDSPNEDCGRKVLKEVQSPQSGKLVYHSEMKGLRRKTLFIEKPEGRFLDIRYFESKDPSRDGKVGCLIEPLGPNGESIKSYQFHYEKDFTEVLDALGNCKRYHFDKNQRLTSIHHVEKHHGHTHSLREEKYAWSTREGQEGWLRAKSIKHNNKIYHLKTYRYDSRGNIIMASFYGNLTGEKPEFFESTLETDSYRIQYAYTDDARNLLVEKKTSEGLTTRYEYLDGTNLCTKILESYDGKIQERIFHAYDDNGQIAMTIEDDGSALHEPDLTDVTVRKITHIDSVKNSGPSFGKPAKKSEFYRNPHTGQTLLIKRTEYFYDEKGREIKQRVHDANNAFAYETSKEFDERGNPIRKSNPLGHVTEYRYDKNNNKVYEKTDGSGKTIYFEYDLANRLVLKRERHHKGETFITTYAYNGLSQLISETDPYGHATTYSYDRYGNQNQCVKPLMQDAKENLIHPTVTKTYNLLNQVVSETDENGYTTNYAYNAYGSPTQIIHPDGATERFTYYPSGKLKQQWKADGTSIHYTLDPKGRIIKESSFDQNNVLLKEEHFRYKGPYLQSKLDAMGLLTSYVYDGAGRKIEENIGSLKTIRTTYDSFDNPLIIETETRVEIYQYDSLNRVISKILQDSQGNIYAKEKMTYDIQGNRIEKAIWQSQDKIAYYKNHYHFDGTLHWKEDPLGERSYTHYSHHHTNHLNQRVQCRSLEDPLTRLEPGRHVREDDDVYHRLMNRNIYQGDLQLSANRCDYDARGHLVRHHSVVMEDGKPLREYSYLRSYNSRGFLESETELPAGKTTRYAYDPIGRIIRKEKPDGVALHYTYDGLGRLLNKSSSDDTVSYTYSYDLRDNIIQVQDNVHHLTQRRIFDEFSRLISEEISPGIVINYAYDKLDRVTQMILPDHSFVSYSYDSYYLKKIQRFSPSQELLYEIECPAYDMRGHLLQSRSPAGTIHYTYDLLGRPISIETPRWASHLQVFDPVGNLLKMEQTDPSGTFHGHFSYDRFNHLTNESAHENHVHAYDSLGNCLKKNNQTHTINHLNQLVSDEQAEYSYDLCGNLKSQSSPAVSYEYDALNRLISCDKGNNKTHFLYDSFGRCLQITDETGTKQLLYQGENEIGSMQNDQLQEFRLMHPEASRDLSFAIELKGKAFFPLQDFRGNICALQSHEKGEKNGQDGNIIQWIRYTAFGSKTIAGQLPDGLSNPWRFANRREVGDLTLFTHRFYNPQLMRWQTTDPLGFEDGLNLYAYVRNNPFYYRDLDGCQAGVLRFTIIIVEIAFGVAASPAWVPCLAGAAVGAVLGWATYEGLHWLDHHLNQVEGHDEPENEEDKGEKGTKEKFKFPENPDDLLPDLPRDDKGRIHTADNLRIRPEKHEMQEGETYNPRHHGQHYHVETRRDPNNPQWNHENKEILKPKDYHHGKGTGFLPGETFPGML